MVLRMLASTAELVGGCNDVKGVFVTNSTTTSRVPFCSRHPTEKVDTGTEFHAYEVSAPSGDASGRDNR